MANYGNYGNYGNSNNYGNDYSTTAYGAQGGADGGGFLSGSQPQGSQGGGSKYGKESLRPCTVLQVIKAVDPGPDGDEYFRIDGTEVGHVHVIGQIRNIAKHALNITYVLDDGTGTIDVKVWQDPDKQTADDMGNPLPQPASEQGLEVGKWARCFGKIKQLNNRRHIGSNTVRPLKDMNEINYHLLEATAVHLFFTRGPPEGAAEGGQAQAKEEEGLFVDQNGPSMVGFSNTAKAIVKFLRTAPDNNEGYNAQHIAATLSLPIQEVMKAGTELQDGSITYTTVNDDTWALLEA